MKLKNIHIEEKNLPKSTTNEAMLKDLKIIEYSVKLRT